MKKRNAIYFLLAFLLISCAGKKIDDQLIIAARDGDVELARKSLAAGANINACASWEGCDTAIVLAAKSGNQNMVGFLVDNGAQLNNTRPTPLFVAAAFNRIEVARFLLAHGGTLGSDNDDIEKLKTTLRSKNDQEMVEILFRKEK